MPDSVQTAIPAFVGYTETAAIGGQPAPVQVTSLADYETVFGGSFKPTYGITEADAKSGSFTAPHWDGAAGQYVVKHYAISRLTPGIAAPIASFNLYNSMRLFYANGGGTCYVWSVGTYADGVRGIDRKRLEDGLTAVGAQVGPTLLAIPDAVLLTSVADFADVTRRMLAQCGTLRDRVAILDVYGSDRLDPAKPTYLVDLQAVIDTFHDCVGDTSLDYGAAYFPFLVTSIVQPSEIDVTNFLVTGADNTWALLQTVLTDQAAYLYPGTSPGPIGNENSTFIKIKGWIDQIPATTDPVAIQRLNHNLVDALPLLGQMLKIIGDRLNLLPPSGAVAGLCALVDSTHGVWTAPANIALDSVTQPSVLIHEEQQGSINFPLDGKSINVIRHFPGRGTLVWGARTLDGNSNDWRYVQVRRTIVYIETWIKTALKGFALASNDGKTWLGVVEAVSGFLANLWSRGGLAGDKKGDAFSVECGLDITMTVEDLMEGRLIAQVTVAVLHPAEFIELTFTQQMQA